MRLVVKEVVKMHLKSSRSLIPPILHFAQACLTRFTDGNIQKILVFTGLYNKEDLCLQKLNQPYLREEKRQIPSTFLLQRQAISSLSDL